MRYPNGLNKDYQKPQKSSGGRGMSLEDDINLTNETYLLDDRAVVYKKPTPITVVSVDYPKRSAARITEAYFKLPSTTDYNGIYKGRYLDFEAKECQSETLFPFSHIHPHQLKHLRRVSQHGAIAFIIIRLSAYDKDYLIFAEDFFAFYDHTERKSLPISWVLEHGKPIVYNYRVPCDYLKVIDEYCRL